MLLASLVAALGLAGATAPAAAAPGKHWARSWASIRATAAKVKAVEADFVQKKRMPLLSKPLISKGRFVFHHPGHLRWEYRSPLRSLLEMKNGRVRRYVWEGGKFKPDARQRADAMQVVLTEITLWLSGRFRQSQSFKPKLVPGGEPRLILTPKKAALTRFIRRIVIIPSRQPGAVQRVIIHEAGQATTTLEFTRCQVRYR